MSRKPILDSKRHIPHGVSLPQHLIRKAKDRARKEGRTFSEMVRQLIEQHIER